MKYMGSKNRLAKYIVPIIQFYIDNMDNCKGYLEPFCGGANIIDKIKCVNKIGCDIDEYIIEFEKSLADGWLPPQVVTEEMYNNIKNNKETYNKNLVGYVGYQLSYGAKWFGGYRRDKIGKRQYDNEAYNNIIKQIPNLKGIKFECCSFLDLPKDKIKGYVIYCDPPYRDTTKYKTEKFPYEEYYQWVREMSKDNIVLCSEYNMPDDFECVWEKKTTTQINSARKSNDKKNERIEKLYLYKY